MNNYRVHLISKWATKIYFLFFLFLIIRGTFKVIGHIISLNRVSVANPVWCLPIHIHAYLQQFERSKN